MSDIEAEAPKKRRGRPKGSVNKNKKPPLDLGNVELPLFGKTELDIPELMAYQTPNGKWKIANPKTQERNLSTRQGVKSVKLVRKHINNAVVITHEDEDIPLSSFSKADRKKIDDYDTLRDTQRGIPVANRPEVHLGQMKERGRPETLPKNIAVHKERGTRPGHSKGKKKGKKGKDLSKPIDFGDSDDDDDDDDAPSPKPKTPRPKTPRTPTPRPPPRGSPLPALRMPTNEEMGFDSDGNDIETPSPPRRARTPTPRAKTPTPKEKTPRPKKSVGRPAKYGDDDEARNKAIKEQKKLSAQLIYRNSLSQEARDKYDAKQAKKAGKQAPAPASKEATPIPKTPRAKTPTPRPPTPTPPTPQASVSQSSSTSKEDKKAEKKAKKMADKLEEKIREKATKKVDEKYTDLSPSEREKKIKKYIDAYTKQKEEGKGLVDVFNKVKDTATALVYGRNDYPPQVRTLLEQVKDKVINSIKIVRTPLSSVLTGTLNALSLGQFKKNMKGEPFDKLYHLAMVFTAERENYLLEKNEVINFVRGATIPNGESTDVSPVPHLTIGEMLEATHKQMGDKFFQYNAIQNNCQDFISNVLSANRIGGEQAQNFVKQNVKDILKNAPITRRITNAITNIGEKFNIISQGAGAEDLGNNKRNKISGSSIKMPRTKLVKGSKEAKEFMAKMRGMRGKKKSSGGAVMKPESESDEDQSSSSESEKEEEKMDGEGARRRMKRRKLKPMPMYMEGNGVKVIHHHHHHHHTSDGMGLYVGGEI